jgi:predicted permease
MSNDLRFALRTLWKSPVFTAVAVLSLALGIGANTAIFTFLDQILLRLLPVKNPQQLVLLTAKGFHYGGNWADNALSYPMYRDFREHNSVFTDMFCRYQEHVSLGYQGHTERVISELVSGSYFPVLGVGAAVGRTLTPDDDRVPNGHPVLMLSYSYWKSHFAGDPSITGKIVVMNGHNYKVIGVAQKDFDGMELGYSTQVFLPIMMREDAMPMLEEPNFTNRRLRWVHAYGRLKPGVTRRQAEASLQPFFHAMLEMEVKEAAFNNASAEVRKRFLKSVIEVWPGSQGRSDLRQELNTPLWALMAITGGVLLIACANVASLLIARATSRQKEIAIRLALGAGRVRIMRQLGVESLLLSSIGGGLGLLLALWTDRLLMALLPSDTISLQLSTTPDLRVLGFTIGVSLLTGILFGLFPALQGTRPDVAPTLKDQVGGIVGSGAQVRFRKGLVVAQVSLSLLLLVGAGLFVGSLRNLRELGPGFSTSNLVSFNLDPSTNGYSTENAKAFYRRLVEEVNSVPGVQSTGLAGKRILDGDGWDFWITVEGHRLKPNEVPDAYANSISPGYLATLGVPILAGRDFTAKDTATVLHEPPNGKVAAAILVNERLAKGYFGSAGNAIGRHVGLGIDPNTKTDMEIVGVFKDIKYTSLRDQVPAEICVPYMTEPHVGAMTVYMRTTLAPAQFFGAVRAKVRALDSNLPMYAMTTLDEQVSNSLLVERLIASLSMVFGFLATLLAVVGLYGVMAYTVTRRTREIGIRMALGAFQKHVIWIVMREVLTLVAIGIALGLGAAIALTRLVQAQLYGITASDPATLVVATLGLATVACVAGYIPAFRASRVDAMEALRYE